MAKAATNVHQSYKWTNQKFTSLQLIEHMKTHSSHLTEIIWIRELADENYKYLLNIGDVSRTL